MKINIGLKDAQRKPVVGILNRLLVNEVLLYEVACQVKLPFNASGRSQKIAWMLRSYLG